MQIEIYSDVVCPWCYIGKRRLDNALAGPAGEGVAITWRPFQLYPTMPVAGMERAAFLAARYGAQADRTRIPEQIRIEAEGEGLELDFGAIGRMPNTLLAHRLLDHALAAADGVRQHALAEVLFSYYFCEGRDIGDVDVLLEAAAAIGLDSTSARNHLAGNEGVEDVRTQIAAARDAGITGVPCYVLGGRFALPGAQTAEVMAQVISRAKERLV
jgi:predicted DsbA family dithiol-disulfide isomerase